MIVGSEIIRRKALGHIGDQMNLAPLPKLYRRHVRAAFRLARDVLPSRAVNPHFRPVVDIQEHEIVMGCILFALRSRDGFAAELELDLADLDLLQHDLIVRILAFVVLLNREPLHLYAPGNDVLEVSRQARRKSSNRAESGAGCRRGVELRSPFVAERVSPSHLWREKLERLDLAVTMMYHGLRYEETPRAAVDEWKVGHFL